MILFFNWEISLLPSFEQTPKTNLNFKMTTWARLLILSTGWNTFLTPLCILATLSRAMQSLSQSEFDLEFGNHSFGNEVTHEKQAWE